MTCLAESRRAYHLRCQRAGLAAQVLAAVVESPAAAATLTPVQRRVAETFHHDFKRSGIDVRFNGTTKEARASVYITQPCQRVTLAVGIQLPEAARNEVVQLTDEVLYQSMAFQEYTSKRKPVVTLPNGRKIAATAEVCRTRLPAA